jgi:hypothetical protein
VYKQIFTAANIHILIFWVYNTVLDCDAPIPMLQRDILPAFIFKSDFNLKMEAVDPFASARTYLIWCHKVRRPQYKINKHVLISENLMKDIFLRFSSVVSEPELLCDSECCIEMMYSAQTRFLRPSTGITRRYCVQNCDSILRYIQ